MSLHDEIETHRKKIHTDSYPMSIGELMSMYRDEELDLHPEFQRFFRWTLEQKSRLIESILLGIPIPSIFVQQRDDGVWDVIDGLQRLSTIFEFVGILRKCDRSLRPGLKLTRTTYLPSLEGITWQDAEDADATVPRDLQLRIKRAKIHVNIILAQSDNSAKYELFQRLNTGGTALSDQEVRNCILVMEDPTFYRWLEELASTEDFRNCISLTDRALNEQYHVELVVRFLVFRLIDEAQLSKIGDLGEFLTEAIRVMAGNSLYDRDQEGNAFRWVFASVARQIGTNAFRKFDPVRKNYTGGFLISAFEAIAIGLGYHYDQYHAGGLTPVIEEGIRACWADPGFTDRIGSGVRASSRVPWSIPHGRKHFAPR